MNAFTLLIDHDIVLAVRYTFRLVYKISAYPDFTPLKSNDFDDFDEMYVLNPFRRRHGTVEAYRAHNSEVPRPRSC